MKTIADLKKCKSNGVCMLFVKLFGVSIGIALCSEGRGYKTIYEALYVVPCAVISKK